MIQRNDQPNRPANPEPDYIVDEVREIRRRICEEHGHDVRRLAESLMRDQEQHGDRLVPAPARGATIGPPPRVIDGPSANGLGTSARAE